MRKHLTIIALLCLCGWGASTLSAQTSYCNLSIPIADNSCNSNNTFTLPFGGIPGNQLGMDVFLTEIRLVIRHDWVADLDISVTSPGGVTVDLSSDNGSGGNHYGNPDAPNCTEPVVFTPLACRSIAEEFPPYVGAYLPEQPLSLVHDGTNPNGAWDLTICDDGNNDAGFLIGIELVFETTFCPPVASVELVGLGSDFAQVFWDADNSCNDLVLEYGAPGFFPGTDAQAGEGTLVVLDCAANNIVLDDLESQTAYEVHIRQSCDGAVWSDNGCGISFLTNCSTAPLTHRARFDTLVTCATSCGTVCELPPGFLWQNSTEDDMDWLVDTEGTNTSRTGPADDITGGGNYLYLESSGSACQDGVQGILESSCLMVNPTAADCQLSFYHHAKGEDIGTLEVMVSNDNGATWSTIWSATGSQGEEWQRVFLDLQDYTNQGIQLRFVGTAGDGFRGDMAIDQIELYGIEPTGDGDFVYYKDEDQDGFGNPAIFVRSCSPMLPDGFVTDSTDCDDANADIFPNANEIFCNGIDENCNGETDDSFVPTPVLRDTAGCRFSVLTIAVSSPPLGSFYWKNDPNGAVIFTGNEMEVDIMDSLTTYYVIDSLPAGCKSEIAIVNVLGYQKPALQISDFPIICAETAIDLSALDINDLAETTGSFVFKNNAGEILEHPLVTAFADTVFYTAKVTPQGCSDETTVNIYTTPTPKIEISEGDSLPVCPTGNILLSAHQTASGTGQHFLQWDDLSTLPQREINGGLPLTSRYYHISITDELGCTDSDSIHIATIDGIAQVQVLPIEPVTFCGGNDGRITIEALNGQAPFLYEWTGSVNGNGQAASNTLIINNLEQGTYSIRIKDATDLECEMTLPLIQVTGPGAIIDSVFTITPVTCVDASDGIIDMDVESPNAIFEWSNGNTTEDLVNIAAGTYNLTVTDGSCINVFSGLEVPAPDEIQFTGVVNRPATCLDATDGSIQIQVNGGTPPYQFDWNNGMTGDSIAGLGAFAYQVTVTDNNGCTFVPDIIQIETPQPIEVIEFQSIPVSCFGESDGSVAPIILGGQSPYRFQWSNGDTTAIIQNIPAGMYHCTITDAVNCSVVSPSFLVASPADWSIVEEDIQQPRCNGFNDGSLLIDVDNETGPLTYNWNTGQTTNRIDTLTAGFYQVTVTDTTGCVLVQNYEIENPLAVEITAVTATPETCEGREDGTISLSIDNATSDLTFMWNNNLATRNINDLPDGAYQLTITNAAGCTVVSDTIIVEAETEFQVMPVAVEPPTCTDSDDGEIIIQMNPPDTYTYMWSNGSTDRNQSDLMAGAYQVTVTNPTGCQYIMDTVVVENTNPLQVNLLSLENNICAFESEGSIDVEVSGGNPPYIFNWNNADAEEDLSDLASGNYQLTVIDAEGCSVHTDVFEITAPDSIHFEITNLIQPGCEPMDVGAIDLTITGGNGSYTYLWSNDSTTQDIDQLTTGKYAVTITDGNGCIYESDLIDIAHTPGSIAVETAIVQPITCFGDTDGALTVTMSSGIGPYQYNWSNTTTGIDNPGLGSGTYDVTVTDVNGCTGVAPTIILSAPELLSYEIATLEFPDCPGDSTGAIAVMVDGGYGNYVFEWSNGAAAPTIANLPADMYDLTITDEGGCSLTILPVLIPEAQAALQLVGRSTPALGNGANGTAAVEILDGDAPFNFEWDENAGGQTDSIAVNLAAGDYTVTVTDANGCTALIAVVVEMTTSITVLTDIQLDCFPNPNNGQFVIRVNESEQIKAIAIRDLSGRLIELQEGIDDHTVVVTVPRRTRGLYWLKIEGRDWVEWRRIVVE